MEDNNGWKEVARLFKNDLERALGCIDELQKDNKNLWIELATIKAENKAGRAVWGGIGGLPSLAVILWYIFKNMKS